MENLIANPGFETGDLTGWTVQGVVGITPIAHSGSFALQGVGSGGILPSVSQPITLSPLHTNYLISYWTKSSFATQIGITIRTDTAYTFNVETTADGVWRYHQTSLEIPFHPTAQLELYYYDQLSDVDDIYFAPFVLDLITNGQFQEPIAPWVASGEGSYTSVLDGVRVTGGSLLLEQSISTVEGGLFETTVTLSGIAAGVPSVILSVYGTNFNPFFYETSFRPTPQEATYLFRFFGHGPMAYTLTALPQDGFIIIKDVGVRLVKTIRDITIPTSLDTVAEGRFQTLNSWGKQGSPLLIESQPNNIVLLREGDGISQIVPLISRRMTVLRIAAYSASSGDAELTIRLNSLVRPADGIQTVTQPLRYYFFPIVVAGSSAGISLESSLNDLIIASVETRSVLDGFYKKGSYLGRYRVDFEATSVPVFGFENPGLFYSYVNGAIVPEANPITISNFAVSQEVVNYQPYSFFVDIVQPANQFYLQLLISEAIVLYRNITVTKVM